MIYTDEQLHDDMYHCRGCDVTFRDQFPDFYDVTTCPHCRMRARNVALAAHQAAGAPSFW